MNIVPYAVRATADALNQQYTSRAINDEQAAVVDLWEAFKFDHALWTTPNIKTLQVLYLDIREGKLIKDAALDRSLHLEMLVEIYQHLLASLSFDDIADVDELNAILTAQVAQLIKNSLLFELAPEVDLVRKLLDLDWHELLKTNPWLIVCILIKFTHPDDFIGNALRVEPVPDEVTDAN